jgi:hypothetical protein
LVANKIGRSLLARALEKAARIIFFFSPFTLLKLFV